jgi:hypothetical protein
MSRSIDRPEPVEGIEYPFSKKKTWIRLALGFLVTFFGLCAFWFGIARDPIPGGGFEYTFLWGRLLWGTVMLVMGICLACLMAYRVWAAPSLVISEDRLQIQERGSGFCKVAVEFPFENIEVIKFETMSNKPAIGIDLADLDDPETYLPKNESKRLKKMHGRHYFIHDDFRTDLAIVSKKLKRSFREWQDEQDNLSDE